jgi:hypothetical protein
MPTIFRQALLVLLLTVGWLRAVEVVDGPRVEVDGTSAIVSWKLDSPAGGAVRFGLSAEALVRSEKSDLVGREHAVHLDNLQPGARYFFSVGTARRPLRDGSFTAGRGPGREQESASRQPSSVPDREAKARPVPQSTEATDGRAAAPPPRDTWANVLTLRDHYERHGRDFAAASATEYAAEAWRFLQRAKSEGLPAKIDPEGTLRIWDPRTRAFAAYNRQGRTKTFFKPGSPDYFERQPGRTVRLKPEAGPSVR